MTAWEAGARSFSKPFKRRPAWEVFLYDVATATTVLESSSRSSRVESSLAPPQRHKCEVSSISTMMRTSLSLIHVLSLALRVSEAFIFAPPLLRLLPPCGESCTQPQQQPPVLHALGNNSEDSHDSNSGDDGNSESDYGDEDASFYADLREAKNEKLGAPIPDNYFAARAAIDSENEFLNAMKNAKAEFAEAKAETGSVDGAVERIMDGIRKEEELEAAWDAAADREEEEKGQNDGGSDDDDDFSDDTFQ